MSARRVLCVLEELHLTHLTGERQYNYQFVQPNTKNILGSERLFDLEVVGSKEDIEKKHEGEKRKKKRGMIRGIYCVHGVP